MQIEEGLKYWTRLKNPRIEIILREGLAKLIPEVLDGVPGPGLVKVVEEACHDLLDCLFPFDPTRFLEFHIPENNKTTASFWMCPSYSECGKQGSNPTSQFLKEIEKCFFDGKCFDPNK